MRTLARRTWIVGLLVPALVFGCNHANRRDAADDGCNYVCVRRVPAAWSAPAAPAPAPAAPAPVLTPRQPGYLPDVTSVCPSCNEQNAGPCTPAQAMSLPSIPARQPAPPQAAVLDLGGACQAPAIRPADASAQGVPAPCETCCARPTPQLIIVSGPMPDCAGPTANPPAPGPSAARTFSIRSTPMPAPIVSSRAEPMPARTFCDGGSTGMSFGHAPDYGWLRGEVQQSLHGVRLRYSPVDQADPYGGSVSLVGEAQVEGLKDGSCVRVRGQLLNPDARTPAPPYRVLAIESVGR